PAAAAAAKLFIIDRVGDAALVAGTVLLLTEFHTVDLAQLSGAALEHGSTAGGAPVVASALLLVGALAKSAQAPLHGWLPDATEGTTPVSALLQTVVVTGGVVLLMRLRSILVPDVLQAAAIIGGLTAFGGVRLFALTFAAPPATVRATDTPPRLQDVPLVLLAVGALGFGAVVSAGILPIGSGPADEAPAWLLAATFVIALLASIAG